MERRIRTRSGLIHKKRQNRLRVLPVQASVPTPERTSSSEVRQEFIRSRIDPTRVRSFAIQECGLVEFWIVSPHKSYRNEAVPGSLKISVIQFLRVSANVCLGIFETEQGTERLTLVGTFKPLYIKVPNTHPIGALLSVTAMSNWIRRTSLAKWFLWVGLMTLFAMT